MRLVNPATLFQQVLKTCVSKQGRLIGLHVGSKNVGLAASDEHNKIAIPLCVLERKEKNINTMAQDFQTLVTQLSLAGFVVGCPCNRQGPSRVDVKADVDNLHQVKLFIEELRETSMLDGVSYTYWDDYASRCAKALVMQLDINPVDANIMLRKFAAVGILQGYLDDMNRSLDYQG